MRTTRILLRAAIGALCLTTTAGAQVASPSPALLVETRWLAQHLRDPGLVLLHVGEANEYAAAHLPGARLVSMRDVSVSSDDHEKGLVLEMPAPDSLRAMLQRLGISDDSRVVVYYGNDWVSPATRVLFTLQYAGLGDRASLLDGGMQAWIREGRETTAAATPARVGTLSPLRVKPLVVTADYVKAHLATRGTAIVDGRTGDFYDGLRAGTHAGARAGHIAGARSIPFNSLQDDQLRLKPVAELREIFTRAGVQPGDTVVGYCHIGQQATAMLFAARALGHPVLLYDGSFTEWERLGAAYPVEKATAGGKR